MNVGHYFFSDLHSYFRVLHCCDKWKCDSWHLRWDQVMLVAGSVP